MEIVKREEDTYPWYEPILTPLLELGYGFTFGLFGNLVALLCSALGFFLSFFNTLCPRDSVMTDLLFDIFHVFVPVVFCVLIGIQLLGFVACLFDLCSLRTYQRGIRIVLVIVGLALNCMPFLIFGLIGLHGFGV